MFPTRRMAYTIRLLSHWKSVALSRTHASLSRLPASANRNSFVQLEETYVFYCQNCSRPNTAQPLSDRGRLRRWETLSISSCNRGCRRTNEGSVQERGLC